ncbi:4-hydroxy-tetrahydrodipicolinate synthase [Xylophilus sp. Leaf220]|uniref:4-hydroxy-tetrahydrodipicolinate synthase n=1 Tax=Xylophilus sp. Leaf220 TaxID=1735686 RepID=UPI0006FCC9F1|nr:4-hydroxy-tetrahydrodipicolinate synthase [Xylophilus sp. Leaf220]KQM68276.1 4-hydroxy-tetrahydrodipicolinate synthase [Xylophilus sp. Leaf220]
MPTLPVPTLTALPASATPAGFAGLWIPLVTPFAADGTVDHAALHALVLRLKPAGIAGYVACGSTGEAAALDHDEQLAVLDTVLQAAGRLPVVMGVSGYHLGQMQRWIATLCGRPIAGLLVPPPSYVRPAQAGLLHWFRTLADTATVPLVLYDIPYRTGAVLAADTLLALAAHPNIRAIKDCGGDPQKTAALIADGRLQVLAGEDAQIFGSVALGAAGAIAASAHWQTERFSALLRLLAGQRLAEARILWHGLLPGISALTAEPNPAPLKALLAQQGLLENVLRSPMMAASEALEQRLAALASSD